MSDDIVTRLREADWNENPSTNVRLCAEAADEIERWRDLASRLANPTTHMEAVYDYGKALHGE